MPDTATALPGCRSIAGQATSVLSVAYSRDAASRLVPRTKNTDRQQTLFLWCFGSHLPEGAGAHVVHDVGAGPGELAWRLNWAISRYGSTTGPSDTRTRQDRLHLESR